MIPYKTVFIIICCIQSFFSFGQKTFTVQEQKEDFYELKAELKKHNLGLYEFISKEEFKDHYQDFKKKLDTPKTELEFKNLIEEFLTPIQERHISVLGYHSKKSTLGKRYKDGSIKLFPFYVKFVNDSTAYLLRNMSEDSLSQVLPSQILSINNRSIKDIRSTLERYSIYDSGVEERINYDISNSFSRLFFEKIDSSSTFKVHLKLPTQKDTTIQVSGISSKEFSKRFKEENKRIYKVEEMPPIFRSKFYPELETAYLKVGTFRKKASKNKSLKFRSIVSEFFKQVKDSNTQNVIIDLRNNSGGSVSNMFYLLSHLQNVKEKEEVYTKKQKRFISKKVITKSGLTSCPHKNIFKGDIYILTNAGSYSASVMLTTILKATNEHVLIIGQRAGGRHTGTTAGKFKHLSLSNSNLLIRIPKKLYNYNIHDLKNLEPDLKVSPKIEDYFSLEKDTILETTLKYIEDKQ